MFVWMMIEATLMWAVGDSKWGPWLQEEQVKRVCPVDGVVWSDAVKSALVLCVVVWCEEVWDI